MTQDTPIFIRLLKLAGCVFIIVLGISLGIALLMGFKAQMLDSITTMMTMTDKHYWYLSRASGVIGYALFWLSVLFGLLLSTRLGKQIKFSRVFALHKFLSLTAIGFTLFHAGILLLDRFLNIELWQLLTPFGFSSNRIGTAMGQIGFYLLLICAISFYIKQYIGQSAWRWIHFSTFLAYMCVSIHLFMVGSDTRALPLMIFYAVTQSIVFILISYRLILMNFNKA
ncbi:ferric reductase-like protein [Psychrobacter sp. FDAARGOS_221]|nr:ferric reductase-like protein [Psychrobacter sp. FDAARGOS_221]